MKKEQTNADKFLNVNKDDFMSEFKTWLFKCEREEISADELINQFLSQKIRPRLTEIEKTILQNLNLVEYHKITKQNGKIIIENTMTTLGCYSCKKVLDMFNSNLFQFIKEGEVYDIVTLLREG